MNPTVTNPLAPADKLTEEAKAAIRAYVIKLALLPAGALAIITSLLGFFLNDVVRGQAFNKSFEQFSGRMLDNYTANMSKAGDLASSVISSKLTADNLLAELKRSKDQADSSRTEIDRAKEAVQKIMTQAASGFADEILARPELRDKILRVGQQELVQSKEDLAQLRTQVSDAFIRITTDSMNVGGVISNTEPKNDGGGYSPDAGPGRCPKGAFVVGIQPYKFPDGTRRINFQCGSLPGVSIR